MTAVAVLVCFKGLAISYSILWPFPAISGYFLISFNDIHLYEVFRGIRARILFILGSISVSKVASRISHKNYQEWKVSEN
jgi:hypothetical protein